MTKSFKKHDDACLVVVDQRLEISNIRLVALNIVREEKVKTERKLDFLSSFLYRLGTATFRIMTNMLVDFYIYVSCLLLKFGSDGRSGISQAVARRIRMRGDMGTQVPLLG